MVVPFVRLFQPIASLRPLLSRGLPQSELDKLFRARAKMDYKQGIPVNPADRPVAAPRDFSAQAFSGPAPWEIQSFRAPGGISPATRPIPGSPIEDVRVTPSIAESYEPRIATSQPFEEEALRRWQSGAFEPRRVTVGLRGGGEMDYVPLVPDEIKDIERVIKEDPGIAYLSVLRNYDEASTPQEFGRAMEQARVLRQNMVMDTEYEQALNYAFARAARRFGVPETKFEEIVSPILYSNSRQLPSERVAESFTSQGRRQDRAAALTDSERFEVDNRKVIAKTRRLSDLDELDTKNNGSIYRAFAAGEINAEQAKRLIDQVNYRRVRLLQDRGTLPKGIKNNTKDEEGVRGIGLLVPSVLRGSDAQKATIYKTAIQTSESSEELAQVYSIARADVTSPEYLDVIEDAMDAKTSIISDIEGVEVARLPIVGRSTIDEGSVVSANRAQRELDVARAEADRPENQGPIIRRTTYNPETKRFEEEAVGTVSSRRYTIGESENVQGYSMGRRVSPDAFEASTAAPPSEKVFVRGVGYSKRNEPLSALRMKLKDGRTIEEAYQLDVKGYRELADSNSEWAGQPWKKWMEGKGKPTLNGQTPEELDAQYTDLWRTWFRENPTELDVAAREIGNRPINDMFASPGSVSQSKSVHEVLVENGVRYTGEAAPAKPSLIKNPQLAKRVGNLDSSDSNQVFVFGSNLEGVHGAGAARTATDTWGAQQGVGKGLTGRAYAFPTKRVPSRQGRQLSLEELSENFRELFDTAASNPDKQFMVSPVGTGLGGYRVDEIAELIARYDVPANVKFVDTTTEEAERFVMAIARAKSLRQA